MKNHALWGPWSHFKGTRTVPWWRRSTPPPLSGDACSNIPEQHSIGEEFPGGSEHTHTDGRDGGASAVCEQVRPNTDNWEC